MLDPFDTSPHFGAGRAMRIALVALVLLTTWLALLGPAAAASEARLIVVPGEPDARGSTKVSLAVEGLPPTNSFNGYEVVFQFDPGVARLVTVEAEGDWNIDLVPPRIDPGKGTVRVTAVALAPTCRTGCGLASLVFAGVGSGGPLSLTATSVTLAANASPIAAAAPSPVDVVVAPAQPDRALPFRAFIPLVMSDGAR